MVGRRGLGCTTLNTGLGCDGRLWEDYGKRLPMYTRHIGEWWPPIFWHVLVVRPPQVAASSDAGPCDRHASPHRFFVVLVPLDPADGWSRLFGTSVGLVWRRGDSC